jgi:serine/threonine-protein kinase
MWSVGPFELIHRIGAGAMGEVWYANHREADVPVAIKVVTGRDAGIEQIKNLFTREVRAAARLHHPGIVRIHDQGVMPAGLEAAGLTRGAPFCAMEWLPGGSLKPKAGKLNFAELKRTLVALLDALAHAHARGLVHRDLKPGNVLLADRGPASGPDAPVRVRARAPERRAARPACA